MRHIISLIIIYFSVCSCQKRCDVQEVPRDQEVIKIESLPFFGQWGYGRKYEIISSGEIITISCISISFTQSVVVNGNPDLANVITDILNDLEYGFPDSITEIGIRPQDFGGLNVIGKGKSVAIYKYSDNDIGFYEKRLIVNIGKLKTLLDEYDMHNGL